MKKILLFMLPVMALCLASCEKWTDDSPIIQFKDPKFLEAILIYDDGRRGLDKNGDGQISEKEAAVIEGLGVVNGEIRNMDEIKYFTALTFLDCQGNQLTSLDVSNNTALTELLCLYNQLTSLDVSKNTALTSLNCGVNQLTSLDVSKNTALTDLSCDGNQLTKIILPKYYTLSESNIQRIIEEYGNIIEYVE